ncbi:MAG: DegV family EDD domain-containing protein [Acholeplasmataceae bacterium]|nr:DegV family EDD domain-containing protein [Acholeplasmataceae bacterium]
MTQNLLTNELIFKSFMIGAKNVIHEKNNLNAINVFPVPDGDTGSNLASMMTSILERSKLGQDSVETMQSIADAALVGARGNSGIIFAQYINGFSMGVKKESIDTDTFVEIVSEASNYAYKAIAKPVEGTIITLMRSWALSLKHMKDAANNFIDLMLKSYEQIKQDLLKTTEMLAVLKENKVVDAGAKGFVHFIEGFIKALKGEEVSMDFEEVETLDHPRVDHLDETQTRYCTEALLRGNQLDVDQIKQSLETLGDSLVVAGSDKTLRIHIHTDHPDDVFAYLNTLGRIAEQKVDDMKMQFEVANHRKYPIALVTDSIADLPIELVEKYQIHMFPINLLINETNFLDKVTIHSSRFYDMMNTLKVYPTSSQPNAKSLENFFSFLTTYYREIIVLTVSQKMSGTYQAFVDAAAKFEKQHIKVVDSRQNSGAEGLLVLKAAQMIESGKKLDDVVSSLEQLRQQTKILVSVKTLKYMVRSGRVSKVTGLVGKILNLKPVISIDEEGNGIIFDKGLSLRSSNKKIRKHVEEIQESYGIDTYAIVHANAPERALEYAEIYESIIGKKPEYTMDISTIVAMNAGIGTVAIAYIRKDKS